MAFLNLFGIQVISVNNDDNDASIRVLTVAADFRQACPACAVLSLRMHLRRIRRVRGILVADPVRLLLSKHRLFCHEASCARKNFVEATPQVPRLARCTARLKKSLKDAVIESGTAGYR